MTYDREFWAANCHLSGQDLARKYGGDGGNWRKNIRSGKRRFPDLDWFRHDHALNPVALQEVKAEMTPEQAVEKDREVRRLRDEITSLRAKLDSTYTDSELEERICAHIDRTIPALKPIDFPRRSTRRGTPETAVALFSDYHIGEVVDYEGTGGLNEYNFTIFRQRLAHHAKTIASICKDKLTGYDIDELVIIGLGDMVSGIIHDELVETSDGDLMDWLIQGSHDLAQAFRMLAGEFAEVRIEWHFGNHGRTTQKPRYKRRWVNYDYLLGHMIATELRDQPNVTFTNHKSFWSIVPVNGVNVLALHGDNIKGWNGIPLYGINRAIGNLTALLSMKQKSFDIAVLGHFHQTALLERMDCDVVLNGSAIGGNEFSYGALFAGNKPRQVLFGVHPKRGKTWLYQLDLSEADDAR